MVKSNAIRVWPKRGIYWRVGKGPIMSHKAFRTCGPDTGRAFPPPWRHGSDCGPASSQLSVQQ